MTSPPTVLGGTAVMVLADALTKASARTGRSIDDLELQQWVQFFSEYAADELRQAFWNYAMHEARPPTIAGIFSELQRLRFGGAPGAWQHAFHAAREVRSSTDNFYVVFEHAAIHFAIHALGGWPQFQDEVRRGDGLGYLRHNFSTFFEEYRFGTRYPAGFGHFTGCNVVLIGHAERALAVYKGGVKSNVATIPGLEILSGAEYPSHGQTATLPSELLASHLARLPEKVMRQQATWETEATPAPRSLQRPGDGDRLAVGNKHSTGANSALNTPDGDDHEPED